MQNSRGRINIVDKDFKEKTINGLVWGGTFSDKNLKFNELNVFKAEDIVYLDDKYGSVNALREEGYVLHAIQRDKLTAIDVGRTTQVLPDGSTQYLATNQVLGNQRPMIENVGTVFPLSVIKNNRHIYYYDIYSGEVYRKAPNGQIPISDLGMSNYFTTKSKALLDSGISNIEVIGGWDPVNKYYVLTFLDSSTPANNETIAFHEPSNRWVTFYSFVPELYARIGENVFISFTSAALYTHNSNTQDRCTFYGSAYDSEIWVVSNISPTQVKKFDAIEIDSNSEWTAPDTDDIIIAEDSKLFTDPNTFVRYKPRMSSRIKQMKYHEGNFRAAFKRDAYTSTGAFSKVDLVSGRPLRGKDIIVKLKNSDTDEVNLRSVAISSTISK
jgi:hypothetical protein